MSIPRLKSYLTMFAAVLMLGQVLSAQADEALPDFTTLVEQASPAVVNISTKQKLPDRVASGQMPDLEGLPPMFREFFERNMPQQPRSPRGDRQREAMSLGSGFIISSDGYVLTNNHVVADADEIIVRLSDRSELQAKLIGTDPRTDVALLKVEGKNLPTVKLGDSELKVGEWVLAIGSPFGFDHSVTKGIVSAKGRTLPNDTYVPFIQTDVAINPGNSGGPLFNMKGEVVGINSQIFTRSGGFMGLSFAIPIDVALDVSNQLKKDGKVSRGWLGMVIQEVNKDLAESFGLDKPAGALVAQVLENGPAAKGGLQVGDVILSMNGQPIVMSADLPHLVGSLKDGEKAKLEIIRNGKRQTLDVAVGPMPDDDADIGAGSGADGSAERNSNRLGVSVSDLTAEQKKTLELKGGVVIKEVQDGPAAMIGLRPGDVISHLNNQAVVSAKQFTEIARTCRRTVRCRCACCVRAVPALSPSNSLNKRARGRKGQLRLPFS